MTCSLIEIHISLSTTKLNILTIPVVAVAQGPVSVVVEVVVTYEYCLVIRCQSTAKRVVGSSRLRLDQGFTDHRTGPGANGRGRCGRFYGQAGAATTNARGCWICTDVGWQCIRIICAVRSDGGKGSGRYGRSDVEVSE